MIQGRATAEGTARYRERFTDSHSSPSAGTLAEGHFRRFGDLWLSSIGFGTYLGEADDATDERYEAAVLDAIANGCNVFDTAINYRHQRSERAIGRALATAFDRGLAARDEIFISTKGGFLPFDRRVPSNAERYWHDEYVASGLVATEEIVAGCHALTPAFLADQVARSRGNLGLETLDLYSLHNPETQLEPIGSERLESRLVGAFARLHELQASGAIGEIGVATWGGLRKPPGDREHLALEAVTRAASPARLAAVQLPINVAMPEAIARPTQLLGGEEGVVVPARVAAASLGAALFASASIFQGRLATGGLPTELRTLFPNLTSDAQRALQFTRSAPGVTTALVGMADPAHVAENLAVARVEPAGVEPYARMFGGG